MNPYRTPADVDGADDPIRPMSVPPLDEYLESLRAELGAEPYRFQPIYRTTLEADQTCTIVQRPQRGGRLLGLLFDPRIADDVVLVDLRCARESAFHECGEIPGGLLTLRMDQASQLLTTEAAAMLRFNPMDFDIGNSIDVTVRARVRCEVSGALVVAHNPFPQVFAIQRLHAQLKRYEAQQANDVRRLAELTAEVEHLRRDRRERSPTDPAPAPTSEDDDSGGAWATPTDES